MTIALVICVLVIIGLVAFVIRGERKRAALAVEHASYKATYTRTADQEKAAREHSVATSAGVVRGNAAQHLAPFMPEMLDRFEPGDWRFLGSPIDFIIFDGLTAGLVTQIVLVEVKTNDSLPKKQAVIKEGIDAGAVPLTCEVLRITRRARRPPPAAQRTSTEEGS
jgi:predicted Holliday junction resolvase-like endonuclease